MTQKTTGNLNGDQFVEREIMKKIEETMADKENFVLPLDQL